MCYNPELLEDYGEYVRDFYEQPIDTGLGYDPSKLAWENLLGVWDAIETDFHHFYGVDLDEPQYRWGKTWRWFEKRLLRLLSEESAVERAIDLFPERRQPPPDRDL